MQEIPNKHTNIVGKKQAVKPKVNTPTKIQISMKIIFKGQMIISYYEIKYEKTQNSTSKT